MEENQLQLLPCICVPRGRISYKAIVSPKLRLDKETHEARLLIAKARVMLAPSAVDKIRKSASRTEIRGFKLFTRLGTIILLEAEN